jgi:aromatic-L-amino-acid decarboxylase
VTPEEFRRIGHQMIDRIADFRAGVADLPVMSKAAPGAIRAALPASAPEQPEDFETIFRDLDELIIPGLSHFQHPSFFGYFPANSELSSVLGDFLSTGLGALGLSWQAAPALTEIEEVVVDWMRGLAGLSEGWSGVIQDTASTSTMVALICARERATGYALARGGLQASETPLTVYVCAHSHSSVDKGALLAGFGRDNLRLVSFDAAYAMRPGALEAAIEAGRGFAGVKSAQMARRGVRLLALLRTGSRASHPHHEHQSELPALEGRRRGEEPARLGHPARPAFSRAEALVPAARRGRGGVARAPAPRHRQRARAR